MKPRKPTETDAQYIARLECANRDLRRANQSLSGQMDVFCSRGRAAASYAGLVLHAAAEAAGVADDPRTTAALECFEALAGLPWSKDIPVPNAFPAFSGEGLSGDAEMVLRSAFEGVMANTAHPLDLFTLTDGIPRARADVLIGAFRTLARLSVANLTDQARKICDMPAPRPVSFGNVETPADVAALVRDLEWGLYDALSDLEMSRAMLRLDLRAAMYEGAFQRISETVRGASAAVDGVETPCLPDDAGSIPF